MRLYADGKLVKAKASVADARVSLARILKDASGGIEVRDGEKRLVIQFEEEFLWLDISESGEVSYGSIVDESQAMDALPAFFEGGIDGPNGTKVLLNAGSFIDVITGDKFSSGCPLCRMVGWEQ